MKTIETSYEEYEVSAKAYEEVMSQLKGFEEWYVDECKSEAEEAYDGEEDFEEYWANNKDNLVDFDHVETVESADNLGDLSDETLVELYLALDEDNTAEEVEFPKNRWFRAGTGNNFCDSLCKLWYDLVSYHVGTLDC